MHRQPGYRAKQLRSSRFGSQHKTVLMRRRRKACRGTNYFKACLAEKFSGGTTGRAGRLEAQAGITHSVENRIGATLWINGQLMFLFPFVARITGDRKSLDVGIGKAVMCGDGAPDGDNPRCLIPERRHCGEMDFLGRNRTIQIQESHRVIGSQSAWNNVRQPGAPHPPQRHDHAPGCRVRPEHV